MSDYPGAIHECDQCHLTGFAEDGELIPDGWHRRDGQVVCERCHLQPLELYLRHAGWVRTEDVRSVDVPNHGVWADPYRADGTRRLTLEKAVAEQQQRDGHGQMDLLEADAS